MTRPLTTTEAHLLRRYLTRTGFTPGEVDAAITGDVARIAAATTDLHQLAWHVDLWATAQVLARHPCPARIDLADRIRTTAEQERTP